jgi:hypothetical protein
MISYEIVFRCGVLYSTVPLVPCQWPPDDKARSAPLGANDGRGEEQVTPLEPKRLQFRTTSLLGLILGITSMPSRKKSGAGISRPRHCLYEIDILLRRMSRFSTQLPEEEQTNDALYEHSRFGSPGGCFDADRGERNGHDLIGLCAYCRASGHFRPWVGGAARRHVSCGHCSADDQSDRRDERLG